MKTHLTYIAVILALLAAIWYLIDHNKAEQANRLSENLRFQQVMADAKARITQLQASRDTLEKKVLQDSLTASVKISALSERISAQSRTIVALRVIAQPKIDENPEIGELVSAQDVQIGFLDSLVRAQELACHNQITDLNAIVRLQGQEITEALALAESEKQRGDAAETAAFEASGRWGIGLQAGWGVMSTGGEVRTGPTISAGVTYKLLGFKRKR